MSATSTTAPIKLTEQESITVRGARVHNLKNIDVDIPHEALTVVTGVSGSGKSSLAFDTIYAEGQRRYVESLSAYARQFLERMEKPDVDSIDGIAPGIAIRQKNTTRNPRSTVATTTEIYDHLRLLYARAGTTFCIKCGAEVRRDTVDDIAASVLKLPEGTRFYLLFPLLTVAPTPAAQEKPKKRISMKAAKAAEQAHQTAQTEALKSKLFDLRKRGFTRLFQNGKIFEFSTPESLLEIDFTIPVWVMIDRLSVAPDIRARLVDGVEVAYKECGEVILLTVPNDDSPVQQLRFSQAFECKTCRIPYQTPEPRLFSFNNPFGACPRCQGFGNTIDFDMNLVIPDRGKTLNDGAIEPWTKPKYRIYFNEFKKVAAQADVPLNVPFEDLTTQQKEIVMEGYGKFSGVNGFFAYLERKKYKLYVRVFLSRYRGYTLCSECKGQRLRAEARCVKLAGLNICEVTAMTVEAAFLFLNGLKLTPEQSTIAEKILDEVRDRLRFLNDVGLEYLTLDRLTSTLSGGEAQRIQLATALASRLVGALYVLDEPSIGLHPRDTARLIYKLIELRDLGNTVLVVEHDPEVMQSADYILDLGPGAGEHGGNVIARGKLPAILKSADSLTGRYLSGRLHIIAPPEHRSPGIQKLRIKGARLHNLKKIDVDIPLGLMVAVTGVSGSGKSTLVHEVLYKALAAELGIHSDGSPVAAEITYRGLDKLEGVKYLSDVQLVDQSPIGMTPRSNPVTYLKVFSLIRELLASTPQAQKSRFTAGHFSFNVPGGRCETCQGDGTVTVEMQFLADVELICEECRGTRFQPSVLAVRYKNKNVHEILQLTVREAIQFFAGLPKIVNKLRLLDEVGLGYLRLGQSSTTLSGGEAQRLKLAAHLEPRSEFSAARETSNAAKRSNRTLYIFDEPTTGLHFDDVNKLLASFRRLLDTGASVLVIEHNLDVIRCADWVIDLGPEGGDRGGHLVAEGTPEDVAKVKESHTGQWLSRILHRNG